MKCPVCAKDTLEPRGLTEALPALHCSGCGGDWIRAAEYRKWRDALPGPLEDKPAHDSSMQLASVEMARLCPECGRILAKYKVGHSVSFNLDRCGSCGGVWFDKDEWLVLQARNLHDDLQAIFTEPWQSEVRRAEVRASLDLIFARKFGAEAYGELKKFKFWLDQQPDRSQMLAFLNDSDPYEV